MGERRAFMYSSGCVIDNLDEFATVKLSSRSSSGKYPVLLNAQFDVWKKDEGPALSLSSSYVVPLIVTSFPPQFIWTEYRAGREAARNQQLLKWITDALHKKLFTISCFKDISILAENYTLINIFKEVPCLINRGKHLEIVVYFSCQCNSV